jgi:hypothetical protein
MTLRLVRALIAAGALIAAVIAAGPQASATSRVPTVSVATSLVPTDTTMTLHGVGELQLGRTIGALREDGLVGDGRRYCDLSSGRRMAPLKPPLKGTGYFDPESRLEGLIVTGGAGTEKGIRIGSPVRRALEAYPKAIYRPPPSALTHIGLILIGALPRPNIALIVNHDAQRVSKIVVGEARTCALLVLPDTREGPGA